ncbi:MAG: protein jag [Clostridia bacterium]|nr:protein jag [Clostridia bacterium]
MRKECIASGKTLEAAIERGARELGVSPDQVSYEVIAEAKKGFLGFGEQPAKVKVIYELLPIDIGVNFVKTLIEDMQIEADITLSENDEGNKVISIAGDDAGMLIGHHGETLDQLQYLVNLAANKKADEDDDRAYTRILVDIEGYRAKREQTLRNLARRTAARVLKYKRSVTLEPMCAYERRIIHSEVQGISGVMTNSIGVENNRRIVVFLDNSKK